jgi:hypothetical protein
MMASRHSETVVEMRRRWSGLTQPADGSIGVLGAGGRGSETGSLVGCFEGEFVDPRWARCSKEMTLVSL